MPKCFLPRRRKTLWSNFKNDSIKVSFQKNSFFLSTILWTARMRIWRKCWIFCQNPNFLLKLRGWTKSLIFLKKYFFSNSSPGLVKCSLDNRAHVFFAKVLKKVVWKSKNDQQEHILYLKVVVFSQIVTLDTEIAILTNWRNSSGGNPIFFSLKSWKPNFFVFSPEKGSSKCFFLTLRLQFWQACQKILVNSWIIFCR